MAMGPTWRLQLPAEAEMRLKCLTDRIRIALPGITLLLVILLVCFPAVPAAAAESPWSYQQAESWPSLSEIQASAWIVYDRSTKKAILEKNADAVLYPASTTKIMTALLVLENLPLEQLVTASEMAVKLGSASSKVGLVAGETVMVRDLVAGMMVASGNDAANVFAETMDGSNEAFALRMNEKAAEFGLRQTHFCNPSGLHDDAHVSTARELALLADHAMANDQFREIASLKSYVMPATNKHPYLGWALLTNSNRLLTFGDTAFRSDYVARYTGIKTGTTGYAGNCLVAAAELVDGRELISVLLGVPGSAPGNSFNSTYTLINAAAQIVLQGYVPGQTEPTGPPATPAPSLTPSLTPSPAATATSGQPTGSESDPGSQTSETTGSTSPTAEPGRPGSGGFSGFITADPWRMAFILLGLFGVALYIRGSSQSKNRRKSRRGKPLPEKARRNGRP
jgi:D-alanyl-D-alanine carboxypeptidase